MISLAEFFAPSPEAEIFCTFSTYIVVFTAKNNAFLRDLYIFVSGDHATPFRIRLRSIYAKISPRYARPVLYSAT